MLLLPKIDPKTKALYRGLYAKRLYEEHGTYGKVAQLMGTTFSRRQRGQFSHSYIYPAAQALDLTPPR